MINGHMTATEVQLRMKESLKRGSTPNFSGVINDILRRVQRATLLEALQGTSEDRIAYCLNRVAAKPMIDFACYGTAEYNPDKMGELAIRWLDRLERLAKRKIKCPN